MKFYSVVLKKSIEIPNNKIKYVVKNKRKFAVGTYTAKGKTYAAYRIIGMNKNKK
jgi:hypothetical protein